VVAVPVVVVVVVLVDVVVVVLVVVVAVLLILVVVEVLVVVVVVVSPQAGGVGLAAALHVATPAFLSSLHPFLQISSLPQALLHALKSLAMSFLQGLPQVARAGDAVNPAPTSSTTNPTNHRTPAFMMPRGGSIVPAQARRQGNSRRNRPDVQPRIGTT